MTPRTIHVAHSPDSDDAFMFYALAEGKIDTGDLRYVHELSDIESLNQRALKGELEVTAVSIHAYAYLHKTYALLSSGSSMGDGYGPRLISRTPPPADPRAGCRGKRIAVPGKLTTAYLALRLFQPDFIPVLMAFDQIEEAVLRGDVDLGLLIHEGQLTYSDHGLHLWADMGEWWLRDTGLPLPLGGNVVRRDLGPAIVKQVARDLKASIEYAWPTAARRWPTPSSSAGACPMPRPTPSSGCTSTTGRWITGRGAARRSRRCSTGPTPRG